MREIIYLYALCGSCEGDHISSCEWINTQQRAVQINETCLTSSVRMINGYVKDMLLDYKYHKTKRLILPLPEQFLM